MAYEIYETCLLVPGLSRGECSSWVQAWGSIAAIFVAIWIGRRTRINDERSVANLEKTYERRAELVLWQLRRNADDGDIHGLRLALASLQCLEGWAPHIRIEMLDSEHSSSFANYQATVAVAIRGAEIALSQPTFGPIDFSMFRDELDILIAALVGQTAFDKRVVVEHDSWAAWWGRSV